MNYRLPTLEDEALLRAYVEEHHAHGETEISASLNLAESDYRDWYEKVRLNAAEGDAVWGRSLLLLCFEGRKLVGLLSIRYGLSKLLSDKYGHIGYGVRPTERGRDYATVMLCHALEICREDGLRQVTLGCFRDNPASAAVIRKCGGVLFAENDRYEPGHISQYYTISL